MSLSILVFAFSFYTLKKPSKISPAVYQLGCASSDLIGNIDYSQTQAIYEGGKINIPKMAYDINGIQTLGLLQGERWIEVDLAKQKLYAWEGDNLLLETPISSGLTESPTPVGEFRIWTKLRATRMEGGIGAGYYNLPNVPYVMYFGNEKVPPTLGYALNGTYWHNEFGKSYSTGCINVPVSVAKELYFWASPAVSEGKWSTNATNENPGTKIVIHE